jgi:hypothetical protein
MRLVKSSIAGQIKTVKNPIDINTVPSESLDHIGAAGAGKFSYVNPLSRMDNCIACTAAHIINKMNNETEDVMTAEAVESKKGYTGREQKFTLEQALKYIENATETASKLIGFMDDPGIIGHYAIFPRVHGERCTHVIYGEIPTDGIRYIYDAQTGETMSWDEMRGRYNYALTYYLEPRKSK